MVEQGTRDHVLFVGCAQGRAVPAHGATVALAKQLHQGLWVAPPGGCCGARADRRVGEEDRRQRVGSLYEAATTGPGLDILCLSPACARVVAAYRPAAAPVGRVREVAAWLQQRARGGADLPNPLSGLRVALHATCHGDHNVAVPPTPANEEALVQHRGVPGFLSRRSAVSTEHDGVAVQRGDWPATQGEREALRTAVASTGAAPLEEVSVAAHCGARPLALGLRGRLLGSGSRPDCLALAAQQGADLLVTSCFLCAGGLTAYQRSLRGDDPARSVPVLHLSQLAGLANNLSPRHLALTRSVSAARRILQPYIV